MALLRRVPSESAMVLNAKRQPLPRQATLPLTRLRCHTISQLLLLEALLEPQPIYMGCSGCFEFCRRCS